MRKDVLRFRTEVKLRLNLRIATRSHKHQSRFNSTSDKRFFCSQTFSGFEHLTQFSKEFARFHNSHHCYSTLNHQTANKVASQLLPADFYDHRINLNLTKRIS